MKSLFYKCITQKVFLFLLSAFFINTGFAQESKNSAGDLLFSADVLTEYPLGFGVQGSVYFPSIHLAGRAKYLRLLGAYIDSMNSVAESSGFYNSATGDIIYEVLSDSNYFEFGFSLYQNPSSGWYGDIGYSTVTGSGQTKGTTILEAVSDVSLPAGKNTYDLYGQLTSVTLRAGYKFSFNEFGHLDLSLGVLKPLTSETTIDREVTGPIQQAVLDAANRELDEYMSDTLKNDVYIPLLQVGWFYIF